MKSRRRETTLGVVATLLVFAATTPAQAAPPDGRGYELVSPGPAKGNDAIKPLYVAIAADGERVVYPAINPFGDASNGMAALGTSIGYAATRTQAGWVSRFVPDVPQPPTALQTSSFFPTMLGVSADLSSVWFDVKYFGTPGFVSGVFRRTGASAPELIAAKPPAASPASYDPLVVGAAADGTRELISSSQPLSPIAGDPPVSGDLLYQRIGATLQLVGIDPAGHAILDGTQLASGPGATGGALTMARNPVSQDGARVFFLAAGQQLFARVDALRTVALSDSRHSDPSEPAQPVLFAGASSDGRVAWFVTEGRLLDEATGPGPFLYRATVPDGPGPAGLELVAGVAHPVANAIPNQFGATDAAANAIVSDDGRRIYYASPAGAGSIHLHDAVSGRTELVAAGTGEVSLTTYGDAQHFGAADVSPDGRFLVFAAAAPLTPDAPAAGRQIYRYDAAGAGRLTLVSTGPAAPSTPYDAELISHATETPMFPSFVRTDQNVVSDDGRYVFFQTVASLTSADVNARLDVYRWRDGEGSGLVSGGRRAFDAALAGASADGADVFFTTRDPLAPQDSDDFTDLYDARVGGGFPLSAPLQPCAGDACQGPYGPQPALPETQSDRFEGSGDRDDPSAARVTLLRPSAKMRAALARGRGMTVRVRTTAAGVVTLRLKARLGRRWRSVDVDARTVRRASTVRLRVGLSQGARTQLRGTGALRVALVAASSTAAAPAERTFVLRTRADRTRTGGRR